MESKVQTIENQANQSLEKVVSHVRAKEVETSSSIVTPEKDSVNANGGVLQNEMKQELLDFTRSTNGLSNRHKDFIGLCDRLMKLGRKQSLFRLKGLFYIDPAEIEKENELDLDLNSMEDYVTFLENTKIKIEPLMGMDDDGKITTDWVFDDKPFVGIDFLGNQITTCAYKSNGKWHTLNLELSKVNSKLSELQVI